MEFTLSAAKETLLWVIRNPDKKTQLTVRSEFEMSRKESGTTTVGGIAYSTVRVHLNLKGPLSGFWGADYWFEAANGTLVRYVTVWGGPGTPTSIGEIRSP